MGETSAGEGLLTLTEKEFSGRWNRCKEQCNKVKAHTRVGVAGGSRVRCRPGRGPWSCSCGLSRAEYSLGLVGFSRNREGVSGKERDAPLLSFDVLPKGCDFSMLISLGCSLRCSQGPLLHVSVLAGRYLHPPFPTSRRTVHAV